MAIEFMAPEIPEPQPAVHWQNMYTDLLRRLGEPVAWETNYDPVQRHGLTCVTREKEVMLFWKNAGLPVRPLYALGD